MAMSGQREVEPGRASRLRRSSRSTIRPPLPPAAAGHQQADGRRCWPRRRRRSPTMRPLVHHGDAVGERQQLLEILADDEQAAAAARSVQELPWTNRSRRRRGRGSAAPRAPPAGRRPARAPAAPSAGCRPTACRSAPAGPRRGCRRRAIWASAKRADGAAIEQAAAAEGRLPMRGSTMLSASGDWVSSPVAMRSSGMRPMPSAWARRG